MNEITWTSDDIKLVEKFIEISRKGFYVSGQELTSAYNRILHKNRGVTNCGACLKQMVSELELELNRFKEKISKAEPQANEGEKETMKERMARVRAAKREKKDVS